MHLINLLDNNKFVILISRYNEQKAHPCAPAKRHVDAEAELDFPSIVRCNAPRHDDVLRLPARLGRRRTLTGTTQLCS